MKSTILGTKNYTTWGKKFNTLPEIYEELSEYRDQVQIC